METAYHEDAALTSQANPYAVLFVPPVGRLLDLICNHLSIGGCFRPGNRQLADWLGYASAGQMPQLLSQLACDGWINYDRDSRLIMLLKRPDLIDPIDQRSADQIDRSVIDPIDQRSVAQIESALIDPIDRDIQLSDAEYESDQSRRSNPQRMEDSCLTTTGDSDSVAVKTQIPCATDSISSIDHPILLLLNELGLTPGPGVFARGLAARDWTPQQIRDRYECDAERIRNSDGKKTWGIFWTAFLAGQLAPARADPSRPLDPQSYADDPAYQLGSQAPPPEGESIRDHAARLLPPPTADTLGSHTRDWMYLQGRLGAGDSDEDALSALERYRQAVRR